MDPMDMLQKARSSGYGAKKEGEEKTEGQSRSFPIMEGEEIAEGPCCVKAYGEAKDGQFVIDRIEPEQGDSNEDAIMGKKPPMTFS